MVIIKARIVSINQENGTAIVSPHGEGRDHNHKDVPLLQPYSGRGWGIRAGVESDSIAYVEEDKFGLYKILAYHAEGQFFPGESIQLPDAAVYYSVPKFKILKEGELALQSRANSLVFLDQLGNISLSTSLGTSLEVNKEYDSINQISVNSLTRTEAVLIRNGLIKRDLRTAKERDEDLFLGGLLALDSGEQNLDIVGVDVEHAITDAIIVLKGVFDPDAGKPSILSIPGIKGVPKTDKIVQNIKNPALTEYRIDVNEFSDGISSLNLVEDNELSKQGRLPLNLASRLALGTIIEASGRMPRFDYVFGSGKAKGHGEIWKVPGLNETNSSVDFKIDLTKNIKDPVSFGDKEQWSVANISKFNSALAFQLLLNTRGADHKGNIPSSTSVGSIWSFQVDKEGMTKWNIPASTPLSEPHRKGRSLLWNMDGSLTQSIGKEENELLPSITGKAFGTIKEDQVAFVNIAKTRRDRSWTADFEGSIEQRIGADYTGQSSMTQADGSHAFYYGKNRSKEESILNKIKTSGLQSPSKSRNRLGNSISGRTEGSVEFDLGFNDNTNKQSIGLNTDGMISMTIGEDPSHDSLLLNTAGNIKFKVVNGGHRFEMTSKSASSDFKNGIILQHGGRTASSIQIDSNGVITLRNGFFNSNIIMSAKGDITIMNPSAKLSLALDGTISLGGAMAGIDISPTKGVIIRTVGGSINLSNIGKVEIAANAGATITGPFSHLNTTSTMLSPGALVSPFTVGAAGPGILDPLTGDSAAGFPSVKA